MPGSGNSSPVTPRSRRAEDGTCGTGSKTSGYDKCPGLCILIIRQDDEINTEVICMSMLRDSWCLLEEVESKFGVSKDLVLEWVKEGIVRSEEHDGKVFRVNADDLDLKIEEDLG
jgi:hypothetical protein